MSLKSPLLVSNFLVPPSTEVSHFLAQDNQLVICDGVNPSYKLGELRKDTGYSVVGGGTVRTNKKIGGLFNFRQSPTVNKMLATANDTTDANSELYYFIGVGWVNIATAAWNTFPNMQIEMESFLNYCFFVGFDGTTFLPVASLTNVAFSTVTNVGSMPQAKFIKRYRDRLYIANCFAGGGLPHRVYYSSVPVAGAITWTQATDFFDIDYSEQITGIGSNWDSLIVFTEFSAWIYTQDTLKRVWDTGCIAHRTIKNAEAYLFWCDKNNVWVSTGGRPQAVGNDIHELILNARDASSGWTAEVVDGEYNLYLGTTAASGIEYTNCMATYNIQTGMWRWRELAHTINILARYSITGDDFLYMGTAATGHVMTKGRYFDDSPASSDAGAPISSWWRTRAYDLGAPDVRKQISTVIAYALRAQNLQLRFRVMDKNQETLLPFKPIGSLSQVVNVFTQKDVSGNFIQFEGKEFSTKPYWIFHGFTALAQQDTHQN